MTRLRAMVVAFLLVAAAIVTYAQEPRQEPRPQQQEEPRSEQKAPPQHENEPRPEQRQDEAKPPKQEKQENAKPPREQERQTREQPREQQRPMNHDEHARAADRHVRIPQDRFRANFGRQHTFVVNRTVVVEGQPRFQYAGYWFTLVDPWPAEWLYSDDCYIDDIDGEYFLFDMLHPGIRVALFVVE